VWIERVIAHISPPSVFRLIPSRGRTFHFLLSRFGERGFENFSRSIPAKAENTDNRFVRRGFEECFSHCLKPRELWVLNQ